MSIPSEHFLNPKEAADVIGCTESYVRRLLRDGTIRGRKLNERAWAIPQSEAERLSQQPQKTGRPKIKTKTA